MGRWTAWGFSWSVLFGLAGLLWFVKGKRESEALPLISGAVLMAYPYFVANTWALFGIGAVFALLPWAPDHLAPLLIRDKS